MSDSNAPRLGSPGPKHTPVPWVKAPPDEGGPDSRPVVVGGRDQLVCEMLGPLTGEDGHARGRYDLALVLASPALLVFIRELASTPWQNWYVLQLHERANELLAEAEDVG